LVLKDGKVNNNKKRDKIFKIENIFFKINKKIIKILFKKK
jgi:hypothetical protein